MKLNLVQFVDKISDIVLSVKHENISFEMGYSDLSEHYCIWSEQLMKNHIAPTEYGIGCTSITAAFAAITHYKEER